MFGSRKMMKRGRGLGEEEDKEEGGPAAKKRKGTSVYLTYLPSIEKTWNIILILG